jgi:protein-tyrosine phosphatase
MNAQKMKQRILFVCLGNICRSPSAEALCKKLVMKKGLQERFEIDSAGLSGWHAGEPADQRMRNHALKRDILIDSISRPFDPDSDFDRFDYILGMDRENVRELKKRARNSQDLAKIHGITDFRKKYNYPEIPDPYYGGEEGFELVLDLLEDSCESLLEAINP